jgi:hypothetical protein
MVSCRRTSPDSSLEKSGRFLALGDGGFSDNARSVRGGGVGMRFSICMKTLSASTTSAHQLSWCAAVTEQSQGRFQKNTDRGAPGWMLR